MSLTLYLHPLASYCHKVLIGLYELDVPFNRRIIDLGNAAERQELLALWPIGKFPVLRDDARTQVVAESTIILEYIDRHYGGRTPLVPVDPDRARDCRFRDRFYDEYVHTPVQKIVLDRLRSEAQRDPLGVEQAKAQLETAYAMADDWMRDRQWALGDGFTMADCAAAPALFFANKVAPFEHRFQRLSAYFDRLRARPSYARVLQEAEPYMSLFPG